MNVDVGVYIYIYIYAGILVVGSDSAKDEGNKSQNLSVA
jgi:hypothetical protein